MNVTNNLKLPQYTGEDIFDLQDINKAYDSIDKAYGSLDDARKEVVNIKNEIPKTNATAEVINARGGKETLGKRLDEFGSQLDTKAEQINANLILSKKNSINNIIKKSDYSYYQAVVKNPLDITCNKAVGIYISFDNQEIKNENQLDVIDNGNKIEFQFEEDITPLPSNEKKIGKYNDGCLKNGTIWVMVNLEPNEERVITIKVSSDEHDNNFSELVTFDDTTNKKHINVKDVTLEFNKSNGYILNKITKNEYDYLTSSTTSRIAIKNNTYSDIENWGTTTNNSYECVGTGVIFRDFISSGEFVYNNNICYKQKVRVFNNGDIEIYNKVYFKNNIASGVVNGVIFKNRVTSLGGSKEGDGKSYVGSVNSDKKILILCDNLNNRPEYPDTTKYAHTRGIADNGTNIDCNIGWQNVSPNTCAIPKTSWFSAKFFISLEFDTINNELNRLGNPIFTRATKNSINELKLKLIELGKEYLLHNRNYNEATNNTAFYGCSALELLALHETLGIATIEQVENIFNLALKKYNDGKINGFFDRWNGTNGVTFAGVEFSGRDMAILPYLLKYYQRENKHEKAEKVKNIIHNYATDILKIEEASGGNGMVKLRNDNNGGDNCNGEATALKFLKLSLDLIENNVKRECYNRILARYNSSLQLKNKTAYSVYRELVLEPTSHYFAFATAYYCKGVEKEQWEYNTRSYIMQMCSPSGYVKEEGNNYQPTRRGLLSTALYMASVLYSNGSISDLEQACKNIEYILSKKYPYLGFEFPIDGWNNQDEHKWSSSIESQIVSEIVLTILYN